MSKWLWGILVILVGLIIAGYWLHWDWVGVTEQIGPNVQQYQPAKTLWDFLGVLAIPAAVGLGTLWFTRRQAQENEAENTDNQHEAALQTYIDKMSDLLLANNLRQSAEGDEVRKIARVRTLTILGRLDPGRKASLFQFLQEAGLIEKGKSILDLQGANLNGVHLGGVNLSNVNLDGVNLSGANLVGSNLTGVNLSGIDLSEANLKRAHLVGADLSKANLRNVNLRSAQLGRANLSKADLSNANLTGAGLGGADLSEANLYNANLTGVIPGPGGIDLSSLLLISATMPDGKYYSDVRKYFRSGGGFMLGLPPEKH